jgi:hypothetical protein
LRGPALLVAGIALALLPDAWLDAWPDALLAVSLDVLGLAVLGLAVLGLAVWGLAARTLAP